MRIDDLAAALSQAMGEQPQWENGAVALEYSDGVTVHLECDEENGVLHLYAAIGDLSADRCKAYAPTFLRANLFGVGTRGSAVLAYNREEEKLALWDTFSLAAGTLETFVAQLRAFQETALEWSSHLREGLDDEPSHADGTVARGGGLRA